MTRVVYIGGGFVGLSGAVAYAQAGCHVTVVDTAEHVVEAINRGVTPVFGLDRHLGTDLKPFVDAGRLRAVQRWQHAWPDDGEVDLLCVALPTEHGGFPDETILLSWWTEFLANYAWRNRTRHVLIESTLPPGTMRRLAQRSEGLWRTGGGLAHSPRRDWFGENKSLRDTRRLLGVLKPGQTPVADLVRLVSPHLVLGSVDAVELAKPMENALLYMPVMYAMQVAETYRHVDMHEVLALIGTHFARPTYHIQGGVGGYCVPIAPRYLHSDMTHPSQMAGSAIGAEREVRESVFDAWLERWNFKRVLILGYAYKPGVRLANGSLAKTWANLCRLHRKEFLIVDPLYDPHELRSSEPGQLHDIWDVAPPPLGKGLVCDAAVVCTAHPQFREGAWLEPLRHVPVVLDTTGVLEDFAFLFQNYRRLWRANWHA